MSKNRHLTLKLVAMLVAPVLVLLVLATVGVRNRQDEAADTQRVLALTTFAESATSLLREVEKESLLAARYSGSEGNDPQITAALEGQQQATAVAAEELQRQIHDVDPASEGPLVKGMVANLTSRLATLTEHRATVMQRSTDGIAADAPYQHVADALVDSIRQIANELDEPVLFQRLSSAAALASLGAARSRSANVLALATEVGYFAALLPKANSSANRRLEGLSEACGDRPAEARGDSCRMYEQLVAAQADADRAHDEFQSMAAAGDLPVHRSMSDESPLNDLVTTAVESGRTANDLSPTALGATPAEVADAASRMIDGYHQAIRHLLVAEDNPDAVATLAKARAEEAQQEVATYFMATLLAILVAAVVTFLVARSINASSRRSVEQGAGSG